jgi:hypothetical protein
VDQTDKDEELRALRPTRRHLIGSPCSRYVRVQPPSQTISKSSRLPLDLRPRCYSLEVQHMEAAQVRFMQRVDPSCAWGKMCFCQAIQVSVVGS